MASVESINNGSLILGVDADMRVDNFIKDSFSLWSKTDDTITYKDAVSGNTKSFVLKDLTWTISQINLGLDQVIQGTASFTDVDGVILNVTYKYTLTVDVDYATAEVDITSDTELHFIRASHLGRATVNTGTNIDKTIDRKPRYVFQKDFPIDSMEYGTDIGLQSVWSGSITPTLTADCMGGNSISAMQVVMAAGVHTISRSITSEDWTEVNTIFAGINAKSLTGNNHKIRLFWVSGGTTYYSKYRVIDPGEPFKSDWRLFHLRHFYLDILTGTDKSSITQFGFEIITDGATLIIDEIWRYSKQDILSDFLANKTDFYDVLPFYNANVTWDRRQCEETFTLAYADETDIGGDLNGIAWIGEWRPTSDIVKVELDKFLNSNPLSIGGQIKYTPAGLTMKTWRAKWFLLPMSTGDTPTAMYSSAKTLYESFITDLKFDNPSAPGLGTYSVQPYIWNGLEDPLNILIPKLRRYADAGVTDLIIPMGNAGWGSWKSRVWRYDLANTVREKGDDRLYFVLNSWLDPAFPERRIFLESTIFDNHWMKDESDEVATFSDVTQGQGRVFVYEAADQREYYERRAYLPIDAAWFDDQIVDGVTYLFSYQYSVFRPSLGHISHTGSTFGKDINIFDRWLQRINDVVTGYNISGIVISEWFWYGRAYDSNSLNLYNAYRISKGLPVLPDFDRQNNLLPAATGTNEYIVDDITLWDWQNSETTTVIAAIKALLAPRDLKLWISSNVDNIIAVKDEMAAPWSNVTMFKSPVQNNRPVPSGSKALQHNNARHGTDFDKLNNDPNLDAIWAWNYWGYSRVEAIIEFSSKYYKKKNKVSMALGTFPMRAIPSAEDFKIAIITARTCGYRVSFVGDRNYSEDHFLAMEAGLAATISELICTNLSNYRKLAMEILKIPTTLVKVFIDTVDTRQVAANYLFSEKIKPLHTNPVPARPYLESDIYLGQEIKVNMTLSGRMTIMFHDDHNNDGSTYWRKWVASNPFYRNRVVEVLKGFAGFPEEDYITFFKGVLQNIKFKQDGMVEVVAKSLLQVTNKELPKATDGKLSGAVSYGAITEITLQPDTGIDLFAANGHQYDAAGYFKINTEVFKYTGISDISGGAKTQFKFTGITRAQFITDAWVDGLNDSTITHSDGAVAQQVIVYLDMHPADVINNMLLQAGLSSADINTTSFASVKNDWLPGALVRGILHEPEKIKTYLKELREATFTSLWQDQNQQISLNFLAPGLLGATFKSITDETEIIYRSFSVDDNEKSRITRVTFEYDERPDGSFKQKVTYIDSKKESDYQEQKPLTFKSRWLRSSLAGNSLALDISQNIIRVFGDGRSVVKFDLETKDDDLEVGNLFLLSTNKIQDSNGLPVSNVKYQVVKKEQVAANRWRYMAINARLTKRNGYYAPDNIPDYTLATGSDRDYGFYADDNGKMSNGDDGYFYF